jgi:hypothetical protein
MLEDGRKRVTSGVMLLIGFSNPFEENRGQFDSPALLVGRGDGATVFVEANAITLQILKDVDDDRAHGLNLRLAFEGASAETRVEGLELLPGIMNYFYGDPSNWRTEIPTYAEVAIRDLYPGIDLLVHGIARGRLEYDLVLEPWAELADVVVRFDGSDGLTLAERGEVHVRTALGETRQDMPGTWEILPSGEKRAAECAALLLGPNRLGFEIPGRDASLPLVIDPGLVFSTYLGGANSDHAVAVRVGLPGEITVAGVTESFDLPTTPGAFDVTHNGSLDVFVTRFNAAGSALVYSTLLGGAGGDQVSDLAVDAAGTATVSGSTFTPPVPTFPTTPNAFNPVPSGGFDGFIARLSPNGSALLYSTFLGGSGTDGGGALAVDPAGVVTVCSQTFSPDFPTTPNAYDPVLNGGDDAFVARLDPSLPPSQQLVYSTFLGGSAGSFGSDGARTLAVEPSGRITVAGFTCCTDFPWTPGAFDTTYSFPLNNCPGDGFLARLDPGLPGNAQLVYSTFLSGSRPVSVGLFSNGEVSVAGDAGFFSSFPITLGAYDSTLNGADILVARLALAGNGPADLLYSTFLGGSGVDGVNALSVDSFGTVTIVGGSHSFDFPTTLGAFDTTSSATLLTSDMFVARMSLAGNGAADLLYSTYVGGGDDDDAFGAAIDSAGNTFVAGRTTGFGWPTTPGAYDTTFNGPVPPGDDGVVFKLDMSPFGAPTPGCAGPPSIGMNGAPQIGNASFAITCANAPASGTGLLGISDAPFAPPLLVAGAWIWIDPTSVGFFTLFATSNAVGAAQIPVPIPNLPALVGLQAFAQFAWLDSCAPGGVSASNALSITVQ